MVVVSPRLYKIRTSVQPGSTRACVGLCWAVQGFGTHTPGSSPENQVHPSCSGGWSCPKCSHTRGGGHLGLWPISQVIVKALKESRTFWKGKENRISDVLGKLLEFSRLSTWMLSLSQRCAWSLIGHRRVVKNTDPGGRRPGFV